ncbi:MAG: hypothetical protein EZS28_050100, partial [Streblomastix strix]
MEYYTVLQNVTVHGCIAQQSLPAIIISAQYQPFDYSTSPTKRGHFQMISSTFDGFNTLQSNVNVKTSQQNEIIGIDACIFANTSAFIFKGPVIFDVINTSLTNFDDSALLVNDYAELSIDE